MKHRAALALSLLIGAPAVAQQVFEFTFETLGSMKSYSSSGVVLDTSTFPSGSTMFQTA